MIPFDEFRRNITRRYFFAQGSHALGWAALSSLLASDRSADRASGATGQLSQVGLQHFPAKAKHVIYLHMVGGPPQMDLYDHKPKMNDWYDKDLPNEIRKGQRLTTMTSGQARFPIAPSKFKFERHGKCGMYVTELLPWTSKMVDDMCFIRSMNTEAINHEPAITYMQTGNQQTGRPCLGAWASYGLGSMNKNLPTFVVLVATPSNQEQVQAISARLWQSGYLPGEHAGVSFRATGDPILYRIIGLSLYVSLTATLIAALIGLPLGAFLALKEFRGRGAVIVFVNALMGMPPVVVGLAVFLLLSRSGPLGSLGILFTPRAMIIDSWFDNYVGVVMLVRVVDGILRPRDRVLLMSTGAVHLCEQVGVFTPKSQPREALSAGEVGFVVAGVKELREAKVGDTITRADRPSARPLPGFKEIKPQVFAGLFPVEANQYEALRDALSRGCDAGVLLCGPVQLSFSQASFSSFHEDVFPLQEG